MTRHLLIGAVTLATTMLSTVAAQAEDPIYRIDLNKTQILHLPSAAGSVIVGNPAIADVTVHSPTLIMVVGRGFGETNLIVLDRSGQTMVDADVQVTAITPSNGVRLFNAGSRRTYSCAPYCQPSPVLGDSPDHIATNSPQDGPALSPSSIFDQGPIGSIPPMRNDGELQGSFPN
jgi:hypothetical protein